MGSGASSDEAEELPFNPDEIPELGIKVSYLEKFIEDESLDIQIVCFHPEFKFESLEDEDRANFVNRSPFPMIHILRKSEVQRAAQIKGGENISFINEKKLKSMSVEEFKKVFSYLLRS